MYKINDQLPKSADEQKEHIQALKEIQNDQAHSRVFDHLYETLTILDSKSASLLQFNSIVIAVYTILITQPEGNNFTRFLYVGLLLSLIASFLLLYILWVHWSPTDNLKDPDKHLSVLLKVRIERTIRYRVAWYISICSFVSLIISFVFFMISRN